MINEPDPGKTQEQLGERAPQCRTWRYAETADPLQPGRDESRLERRAIAAVVVALWINAGVLVAREIF